jgi:glycerate 2-kinase
MLFKNYDNLVLNGQSPVLQQKRKDVLDILSAAVDAVQPSRVIKDVFCGSQLVFASESIDLSFFDHVYIVGFGKASVGMAQAVCDAVTVTKGIIITNDPSATIKNHFIEVIVGGHPFPNEGSINGAEKILDLLGKCSENDCVIVLISGGGSSLFCKPRVPLDDLQKTFDMLLHSGVNIEEMNTIRKHLSFVKGGQLAQNTKAVIVSLIISDIVHNPIISIASGPTSPDPSTFSDAREILKRYALWVNIPVTVRTVIMEGIAGNISETLKANDPVFKTVFNYIIATNERACQSAMDKAKELGYDPELITTSITGEARVVGRYLINNVVKNLKHKKHVIITGGETTVIVHGGGTGGRNQELVLSCVEEIADNEVVIASFATDGIDGNSDAAGALADGFTLTRAREQKLNPSRFLKQNNSNFFFQTLGDALLTGPTGTNVMDIQIFIQ